MSSGKRGFGEGPRERPRFMITERRTGAPVSNPSARLVAEVDSHARSSPRAGSAVEGRVYIARPRQRSSMLCLLTRSRYVA